MAEPILLVMGVSGSGKSTLGRALADALGWPFQEGDDLHPPANLAKMARSEPLDDADRAPWLAAIAGWIDGQAAHRLPGVVTCSALKRTYRTLLTTGRPQVKIVYLRGSRGLIGERLAQRRDHFMPADLLDSQFAALEEPVAVEDVLTVEVEQTASEQVALILRAWPFTKR